MPRPLTRTETSRWRHTQKRRGNTSAQSTTASGADTQPYDFKTLLHRAAQISLSSKGQTNGDFVALVFFPKRRYEANSSLIIRRLQNDLNTNFTQILRFSDFNAAPLEKQFVSRSSSEILHNGKPQSPLSPFTFSIRFEFLGKPFLFSAPRKESGSKAKRARSTARRAVKKP